MIKDIKGIIILSFSFLLSISVSAQKETNWWFFGQQAGLNFNLLQNATATGGTVVSNIPKAVAGHFSTSEGCFTISDSNGNLMMSGDGSTIWNKNGAVMPGATGLGGGSSASQSGIIVPVPGSSTRYYSMSVAQEQGTSGIQYAIVDMSLNGGLGGIVSKNNLLLAGPTDENIAAVRKTNSQNWWLVHRRQNAGSGVTVRVWEVTATGITLHGTQTFNFAITTGLTHLSVIKFSPDGTRFVSPSYTGNSLIFGEFDPSTGTPSGVGSLNMGSEVYGAEFSPNGDYVYYGPANPGNVARQIPWSSIKAKTLTGVVNLAYAVSNFQLSPDGRIYAIRINTRDLYVILNPDDKGNTVKMYQFPNYLTANAQYGLPTFAASFFSGKAEEKAFVCRGNTFSYKVEVSFSGPAVDFPVKLVWNWGDGTSLETQNITSTTQTIYTLTHNYSAPGSYNVVVTPYKVGNIALSPITLDAKVIDCKLQVNRMIRINVDNKSTQIVKN